LRQVKAPHPLRLYPSKVNLAQAHSLMVEAAVRTLVVIDDDSAVRNALQFALELEGYKVAPFASPLELLARAPVPAFDCLIVDQRLPAINGLDVVDLLRRNSRPPRPAILITSNPSNALRARAAAAGVPIVEKPLQSDELIRIVRRMVG
jgi:FixJ family two-component response regulator